MAYLVNSTRLTRVLLNNVDITGRVSDISLSDSSGVKNGLIATDGEMSVGWRPGAGDTEDYRRNTYKRGQPVELYVTYPDGVERKHPRGHLFVIDSEFDPQNESITVSLGCKMAIAALDGNISDLTGIPNLYIPSTRMEYSAISSALAAEGRIAWYDSNGDLQTDLLFSGETDNTSPPAEWVSVFGTTALAISSLDKQRSINSGASDDGSPYSGQDPDNIEISYSYADCRVKPSGELDCPEGAFVREEYSETISDYFTSYPAVYYERVPSDEQNLDEAGEPQDDPGLEDPRPSECIENQNGEDTNPAQEADTGAGPATNGATNCMSQYETVRVNLYVGVSRKQTSTAYYGGPGGSQDRTISENYAPPIEINSQYYGDLYQACKSAWATTCNPNGYCPQLGLEQELATRSESQTEFNSDGSVFREIVDNYATVLSAAKPDDWRSVYEDGERVLFRTIQNPFELYRASRVVTEYQYPETGTFKTTTTFNSVASRGTGIKPGLTALDAINGIKTTSTERSWNNAANADLPPNQASPEPPTKSDVTRVVFPDYDDLGSGSLTEPLVFKESAPYPFMVKVGDPNDWEDYLAIYSDYTRRFIKGQSLGLRVAEALREEISDSWKPNTSFRYYDPRYNTLISMRGDAHTWSLTPESCIMTVDGLAIGFSDGQVNIPDNIQGADTAILP